MKHLVYLTLSLFLLTLGAQAQPVPAHAEGLAEKLYTVPLSDGGLQLGVLSGKSGVQGQDLLAVLLPGHPSVVRPVMGGGVMVGSRLTGNFLIRSRRFLADERLLTLVVDCNTRVGDYCTPAYQASRQRQSDVQALIDAVKKDHPLLKEVWLLGTSMGTISSAYMALYEPGQYAGVVHTASITDFVGRRPYTELEGFDYARITIPQLFVHHADDPCAITSYASAQKISQKFGLPLLTVQGGSGFTGDPCAARTQHGFQGRESAVMKLMAEAMRQKKFQSGVLPASAIETTQR